MYDFNAVLKGARNCIEYLNVRKGENVLVLVDATTDTIVYQTLAIAIEEAKAEPYVLILRAREWMNEFNYPYVLDAWRNADAMVCAAPWAGVFEHCNEWFTCKARVDEFDVPGRGRVTHLSGDGKGSVASLVFGGLFPVKLGNFISKYYYDMALKSGRYRYTDEKGTDISCKVDERYLWRPPTSMFPFGCLQSQPIVDGQGVIYFDAWQEGQPLSGPLKYTVEDSMVTKIEGGTEAIRLNQRIEGIPHARHFIEMTLGLNPKAPFPNHRRAGIAHCGIGRCDCENFSTLEGANPLGYSAPFKIIWLLLRPNVFLGDKMIVKEGRFLFMEEPAIVEEAAKYGDPRELLYTVSEIGYGRDFLPSK